MAQLENFLSSLVSQPSHERCGLDKVHKLSFPDIPLTPAQRQTLQTPGGGLQEELSPSLHQPTSKESHWN